MLQYPQELDWINPNVQITLTVANGCVWDYPCLKGNTLIVHPVLNTSQASKETFFQTTNGSFMEERVLAWVMNSQQGL